MSEKLEIKVLGTGTSQGVPVINCNCPVCSSSDPKDNRLRASIAVQSSTTTIMIDIGPDFRQQMLRAKLDRIDGVLFTHEHNDHIAGLDDLRPFIFSQKMDIPVYGLKRVLDAIEERFPYAFGASNYPGVPTFQKFAIRAGEAFQIGDIDILPIEVIHGNLSILAYKMNEFVYITDAKIIPNETLDAIKGVDCLIINALRREEHWSHLNLQQAMDYIYLINPKRAYISHISHYMGFHAVENKKLPDDIEFAYDGMTIIL